MSKIQVCIFCGLWVGLSACSEQGRDDLEAFIAEVKSRPPSGIEPVPEIGKIKVFHYLADDRRDPFTAPAGFTEAATQVIQQPFHPDPQRRKEILENYPLDSLRLVGTLQKNGTFWGLVQTKDALIHRVAKDNYLGLNHGRIVAITSDTIKLIEWIPIGGTWQKQEVVLFLSEEKSQGGKVDAYQ